MSKKAQDTKVLIVEDEPMLLDIAVTNFQRAHFQTLTATDGEEGIAIAKSHQPDVILLDIIMPGIDGFETLARLKYDASTKDIPVIVFSNLALERDVRRAKELGATDFMIKANSTLRDAVSRVAQLLDVSSDPEHKVT